MSLQILQERGVPLNIPPKSRNYTMLSGDDAVAIKKKAQHHVYIYICILYIYYIYNIYTYIILYYIFYIFIYLYMPVIPERNPSKSIIPMKSKVQIPTLTGAFSISSSSSTARSGFTKVLACKRTAPASSVPGASSLIFWDSKRVPSRMLQFKSSYNLQLFRSNHSEVCNSHASFSLGTSCSSLAFYPSRGFLHLPIHGTTACHCLQGTWDSGLVPMQWTKLSNNGYWPLLHWTISSKLHSWPPGPHVQAISNTQKWLGTKTFPNMKMIYIHSVIVVGFWPSWPNTGWKRNSWNLSADTVATAQLVIWPSCAGQSKADNFAASVAMPLHVLQRDDPEYP